MTLHDTAKSGARRITQHSVLGPQQSGEQVQIFFNGQPVLARAGEPVAVALLAAGIRSFRTMPRSGEARGPFCFVGRCTDCLVQIDGVSNVRGCATPVRPGMRVQSQPGIGLTLEDES